MPRSLADFPAVSANRLACATAFLQLGVIPLVAEFVQHVVEMRIGMHSGFESAEAEATIAGHRMA
ncbi:hypothetical protein [Erythrobacter sp.]|uniref:hypothetical protein n=1 Tax=Erythrobacteraceae TaxID=335929 RepID=UPI001B278F94|nr:hypothetical protein [Erythrobacter sp.]MBO6526376.1 hypothetical protein [Erythrobacter sp.]MBO6530352.1 hypothetical protein [Erythrobacter sp.]